MAKKPSTVDDYISQFPEEIQRILLTIRSTIWEVAPDAVEKISYGMPGYFLNGGLIWFGVYKHHIGVYPRTAAILAAIPELTVYKGTKGSVHFPLNQPIPYDLIRRIVQTRVSENQSVKDRPDKLK